MGDINVSTMKNWLGIISAILAIGFAYGAYSSDYTTIEKRVTATEGKVDSLDKKQQNIVNNAFVLKNDMKHIRNTLDDISGDMKSLLRERIDNK